MKKFARLCDSGIALQRKKVNVDVVADLHAAGERHLLMIIGKHPHAWATRRKILAKCRLVQTWDSAAAILRP